MAKEIIFPLSLINNYQVRTIEELREYFDLEKILGYYENGKLLTWLKDRFYEKEYTQIQALEETAADFIPRLCSILGVKYTSDQRFELETLKKRQERLNILKQYTSDKSILDKVDYIAFNQEDLADLLDQDINPIYLCKGDYYIPLSKTDISYIGLGKPVIDNFSEFLKEGVDALPISFRDCYYYDSNDELISCQAAFQSLEPTPLTKEEWEEYYKPIFQKIAKRCPGRVPSSISNWYTITHNGIFFIGDSVGYSFELKKADIHGNLVQTIGTLKEGYISYLSSICNYVLIQGYYGVIDIYNMQKQCFCNIQIDWGRPLYITNEYVLFVTYRGGSYHYYEENYKLILFDCNTQKTYIIDKCIFLSGNGAIDSYLACFYKTNDTVFYATSGKWPDTAKTITFKSVNLKTRNITPIKIVTFDKIGSCNYFSKFFTRDGQLLYNYVDNYSGNTYVAVTAL